MKRFLTIICIAISSCVWAQSRLTNREIFNFNIGDAFQYRYFYQLGGYQYLILDKKPIGGTDSMVYVVQRVSHNFTMDYSKTPPQKVYSFYSDTINLEIPHLDVFVDVKYDKFKNFKPDSCMGYTDTFQYSLKYEAPIFQYRNDVLCRFEVSSTFEEFGKGIGRTRFWIFDPVGPYKYEEEMVYYRKGSFSNGIYDDAYLLGINEPHSYTSPIGIYPNPCSLSIAFTRSFKFGSPFTITDAVGKTITYGNFISETLDISALPNGFYFINISENDHHYFGKFLKN